MNFVYSLKVIILQMSFIFLSLSFPDESDRLMQYTECKSESENKALMNAFDVPMPNKMIAIVPREL